jgi:tagaturonate reductase
MIPYALLKGIETVKDCMDNEEMFEFLKSCVFDEIIPTLDLEREELVDYADSVFERFNNPFIRHMCSSIALNSISKFKVRVLPSILEYIKRTGNMPRYLLISLAKLIEFYKYGTPNDEPEIISFIKEKSLNEILSNKYFWDVDLSFLEQEVSKYVNK